LNQSSVFYKKDRILKSAYNEKFRFNEDFELFHRIRDTVRFYNIPRYLVYTRIRNDSKTYSSKDDDIYNFLHPNAFRNLIEAQSKGRAFYWADKIAWINFFYGDKKDARSYFSNSITWKNLVAFITTYFPEPLFRKLLNSRMKYRVKGFFSKRGRYEKELKKLSSFP
jgi:hypothetical protein